MAAYPDSATAHNRDLALQKYMLLHSQHQSLRERLDQLRPLVTMTSCNTAVTSPAHSPERSPFSPDMTASATFSTTSPYSSASRSHRRSSMPVRDLPADYRRRGGRLEAVVDERARYETATEERKLFDVNECMKRTLTELLNCEDARTDARFRMWVQCRLMETEKELRVERRRRSSSGMEYA
ncbi:hypothetical protein MKZ38_001536 [Zalerion maritima]|uniref:Uncharacterized protein n=1 Tax=Zalerion maritima TaxID=339359 RepID=A0AAD5RRE7_9PEZI|nr:hypothetical protein MKZ38_001536 [Zalerion maritima]